MFERVGPLVEVPVAKRLASIDYEGMEELSRAVLGSKLDIGVGAVHDPRRACAISDPTPECGDRWKTYPRQP